MYITKKYYIDKIEVLRCCSADSSVHSKEKNTAILCTCTDNLQQNHCHIWKFSVFMQVERFSMKWKSSKEKAVPAWGLQPYSIEKYSVIKKKNW